jgi:hypothetical protein
MIKPPSGVMVVCPVAGAEITVSLWNEAGTTSEVVSTERALQLLADLTEAILRSRQKAD